MKQIVYQVLMLFLSMIAYSQQENLQELLNAKQFNRIVALADHLQAADSSDYQTMYLIGQAYEGLLRYNDAYRFYLHCLSIDSTHVELLNTTARMAANLGKTREAESCFLKIWEADTTDFYANYQLARFYVQSGNDEKAIDYYEYLLENDPDNPILLRAIGDCYQHLNERFSAFEAYWFAFQNNKENAGLASTVVNSLLPLVLEDRIELAMEVCDTALFYNPENLLLMQNKATVLFTAKRYTEADSIFTLLLTLGDSSSYNIKYGGCSKYYLGRNLEAIELLEKSFEEDSTAIDVCLLLGSAYGRSYDRKRAYYLFDRVEELMKPNQTYVDLVQQFRADAYVREGRILEAYQIWLINQQSDLLSNIYSRIGTVDLKKITNDDERSRCLFINVLMTEKQASVQNDSNRRTLQYIRARLEQFKEEMFFRGMKEYPMISPDNKKTTISFERLQELIERLPKDET